MLHTVFSEHRDSVRGKVNDVHCFLSASEPFARLDVVNYVGKSQVVGGPVAAIVALSV